MTTFTYKAGDSYPGIKGVISYDGEVDTDGMTARFLANGNNTGPFTATVTREGGDSMNPSFSTFEWSYNVESTDTLVGTYDIELVITHASGEIETINGNVTIRVGL